MQHALQRGRTGRSVLFVPSDPLTASAQSRSRTVYSQAGEGPQLSPAVRATRDSICSSKVSQPPSCTASHSRWGHCRLDRHGTSPSWRAVAMRDGGTQSVALGTMGPGDRGTLSNPGWPVCAWGGGRQAWVWGLVYCLDFSIFPQFYTPQAVGIRLDSYCCSLWLQLVRKTCCGWGRKNLQPH